MECNEAEELIGPYLLGALDPGERRLMESHLDTCRVCALGLQADGETVARLASALPQLQAPPQIKRHLFSRVEQDLRADAAGRLRSALTRLSQTWSHTLLPHTGKAVVSLLVLAVVFGGAWFNSRLNQISQDNEQLNGQLQAASEREAYVMEMVREQRYFTYEALRMSATPGTSVNLLWGTEWSSHARGMIMVSQTESRALLLVVGLPPLPLNRVYQVWLIKGGRKHNAGVFTVDSTGFGQAVIIPVAPFAEYDALGITVEPAGGSADPTGTSVLRGDL